MPKVRIQTMLRSAILDSQGKAVERVLKNLGFNGVENLRIGKTFEIEIEDISKIKEMCEKCLVNMVMENYTIEILDE